MQWRNVPVLSEMVPCVTASGKMCGVTFLQTDNKKISIKQTWNLKNFGALVLKQGLQNGSGGATGFMGFNDTEKCRGFYANIRKNKTANQKNW